MTDTTRPIDVTFDRDERTVLLAQFDLPADLRHRLETADGLVRCSLAVEDADELREQAGELFQLIGLGEDDAPSATGAILDRLIDKLYTG